MRRAMQVHRRRGADRRHVVRLEVVDHVGQRVEPLLHGEVEFVVLRADVRGGRPRGREVGRAFEPDRERVQARPPRLAAAVVLDARWRRNAR